MMRFFTAHVRNGRLLLDELTEHPDGTLAELVPTDSVMWLVPLVEVPPPDDEPADESAASSSRRLIGARANSSNQTSINQRALNTLPIGVPTFPEQQRIAEVLATADCHIREEGRALEKHRLLKQGLMERITRCSASTPM